MAQPIDKKTGPDGSLIHDLLDALDQVSGLHPGFRPAHAKGLMCTGTFTPTPEAATLTRAPHATRSSTPVIVRLSDSTGVPMIPDNDPHASPRGIAIRFQLAEHVHTDIVGHSTDGFPAHTGEEFLELMRAIPLSGPDAPKPTPLDKFLGTHPKAVAFLTAPKPFPTSFATESFFAVTAFRFVNAQGAGQFGRFRIRPVAGNAYLTDDEAAKKSAHYLFEEISERLARGPIEYRIVVQIAGDGDDATDATTCWPDSRAEFEFGMISLTQRVDENAPDMRKIIFDPLPRVDGIDSAGDPLTNVRADIYLLSGRRRRAASEQ